MTSAIFTIKDAARSWGVSTTTARRYVRFYRVRCRVFSRRMIQVDPGEIERVARAVEARWTWPDPEPVGTPAAIPTPEKPQNRKKTVPPRKA